MTFDQAVRQLRKRGSLLIFYYQHGDAMSQLRAENAAASAGTKFALALPRHEPDAELIIFNEAGVKQLSLLMRD